MRKSSVIPAWNETRITHERRLGLDGRAAGRRGIVVGECAREQGVCACPRDSFGDGSTTADAGLLPGTRRIAGDSGVGASDGLGCALGRGIVGTVASYGRVAFVPDRPAFDRRSSGGCAPGPVGCSAGSNERGGQLLDSQRPRARWCAPPAWAAATKSDSTSGASIAQRHQSDRGLDASAFRRWPGAASATHRPAASAPR
jgi:hypothetical protein